MKRLTLALCSGLFVMLSACNGTEVTQLNPIVEEQIDASAYKYKMIEIQGIGEKYSALLLNAGIKYTDDYLKFAGTRKDREALAKKTGISAKLLLEWANHVDLMRIKGVGPKQSNLLEEAGVDSIKELSHRLADNLYPALDKANKAKNLVNQMPSKNQVKDWVEQAKVIKAVVEE
ncbi:MAG: DUF4332 domain-containing protein [Candidatus Sericytochromatia bacterium]